MARPRLLRFDITVYRAKSQSDSARVPAAGAVVEFYRQGATVKGPGTITVPPATPKEVPVYAAGMLAAGSTVRAGTAGPSLTVDQVVSATKVVLVYQGAGSVALLAGTRLLVESDRPNLYADPFGTVPLGSSATADASGRVAGYIDQEWYDYDLVGQHLFHDAVGRIEVQSAWGVNALDYQRLEDALAALPPSGGEIHLPLGLYPTEFGLVIDKPNVTLSGVGLGTMIRAKGTNLQLDVVTVRASGCRIRDLRIGDVDTSSIRTRSALSIDPAYAVEGVTLENVQMEGGRTAGLMLPADLRGFRASGCLCRENLDGVLITRYGAARIRAEFYWCGMNYNDGIGLRVVDEGGNPQPKTLGSLRLVDCALEGNREGLGEYQGNAVSVEGSGLDLVELSGCYLENPRLPAGTYPRQGYHFVYLRECNDAIVDGCFFFNSRVEGDPEPTPRLDYLVGYEACGGLRHSNNVTTGRVTAQVRMVDGSYGVEFGNRNLSPVQRGVVVHDLDNVRGLLSLSGGAVSLFRSEFRPVDISALKPGSLLWVESPDTGDSHLQVLVHPFFPSVWRNVRIF